MSNLYLALRAALVAALLPLAGVAQIIPQTLGGGNGHSVLLAPDGSLRAWGYNANGQLGNGTATSSSSPTPAGTAVTYAQLAVGAFHTAPSGPGVATTPACSATGPLPRAPRPAK